MAVGREYRTDPVCDFVAADIILFLSTMDATCRVPWVDEFTPGSCYSFYLLFFPVSVVMRALGYDPMARRLDRNADSYRVTSRPRDKEHLQRPF